MLVYLISSWFTTKYFQFTIFPVTCYTVHADNELFQNVRRVSAIKGGYTMITTIIFDMDGVLINSEPLHYKIWQQVFAEHGLEIDFEHYKGCIGSTNRRLLELILEGYGRDFSDDPTLVQRFREIKNEYMRTTGIPVIKGVPEVLAALKEKGYRLAVASSSPQDYIELCTGTAGISGYFDVLFSGERVAHPKPAPDVFLAAADRMNAKPEECLVVEDSENGSRAARAAEMKCMGFRNPDSGDQNLEAADRIFDSFDRLIDEAGL